ncbi:hypothetical protein CH354_08715 [Leptospira levettii]|nr:hypothetical protein CH354_08715 [Leptospira levettii]PJZ87053.1 hypothetical protein CH368_18795 [Leptospira levettii]PKA00763.1 hypothetical protein CH369_10040 [Leptospira levettii]
MRIPNVSMPKSRNYIANSSKKMSKIRINLEIVGGNENPPPLNLVDSFQWESFSVSESVFPL